MARLKKFTRVLVANRGEIACRIFHTLREMGIASVAVGEGFHAQQADEAIPIASYLDSKEILAAAAKSGAQAIHPGYGFLSQNADFARDCAKAGIVFIGPSAESMIALGDKRGSRQLAGKCKVPIVPGGNDCDTLDAAKKAAERAGYPVLLKAAGGGGGKGMRRVDKAADLAEAYAAAKREAKAAFADDRMIVEKLISPARHVEVQILGDGKTVIALGERECSLQRRFQKIVEESPSGAVTPKIRKALFDSAIRIAEAAKYANAGTVEFLLGPDGSHYFLEVNTRLQVEHPVTEMLTGLDIVREQINIAQGGSLPEPPSSCGHAIEVRLNAEDPAAGFLPMSGDVEVTWPHLPNVRIDAGYGAGSRVTPDFDSLVAKIIAWGPDRESARRRLIAALEVLVLHGVRTNQSFLIDTLESDAFRTGETFTSTIESSTWKEPEPTREILAAAAAGGGSTPDESVAKSPWSSQDGWRLGS